MVLQKVSQAIKDPTQGKLGPTWEGPLKSSITQEEEATTWRTDGNPLPHPWNVEHLKKYY